MPVSEQARSVRAGCWVHVSENFHYLESTVVTYDSCEIRGTLCLVSPGGNTAGISQPEYCNGYKGKVKAPKVWLFPSGFIF